MEHKTDSQTESSKMTLNDYVQKLKSYNHMQYLTEGALIDAMDNNNSWRVAKIAQIKNNEFALLSYDGWSSRWDETHKLISSKVAPFKKFTPPYTGPMKNTNRTIEINAFLNQLKKNINFMDQITNLNFISDPYVVTQTIRGEIHIIIDSILNFFFNYDVTEHLKTFIEFLNRFIKFFVDYLSCLPNFLKEYIDGKNLNPLLYLVNEKIAMASCFPELFSSICKLFGGEVRCLKFYQANEFTMNSVTKAFVTKPKDRHSSAHTQIVNFVNEFGNLGGFDKFIELLKWEYIPESKKQGESPDPDSIDKFPLIMIRHMLTTIDPIISMMSSSFKDSFLNEIKKLFFLRIENISTKEIKDLDPLLAFSLLTQIQVILDEICVKETFMLTEEAELNLSLKLLKSPFLQKKIRGITHLKECIERTDSNFSDFRTSEPKKKMKFYTVESLRKYFQQNNLLDIILGENFHVEVFKRSQTILKFFATSGGFNNEQLSALWKAVESKHEGYTTIIYELVIELMKSLSLESLEFLFTKIISTPQEKCDDAMINLMTEFSLIAMGSLNSGSTPSYSNFLSSSKAKKSLQNPKNEFFALKYLWDLAQDNSKLDVKYIDNCLAALYNLLKSNHFKSEREKYLTACFDNIKQSNSVPQSTYIALHVLSTYNTYAMFSRESLEDTLNKFNKEYNLNELIISDCEEYLKKVAEIDSKNKVRGIKIDNIAQYIFIGKHSHQDQIENRLTFIQTIDPHVEKKYSISIDQIKRLWIIMIKKAVTPVEQNLFLNWLIKTKETSSSKRAYNFSDSMMKTIFLSIISDKVLMEDYVNLTPEIYNCIQTLFEIVNANEDFLENYGKLIKRVIKYDSIYGMDYFWNILIKCSNETVQKNCRSFLINIHLKFASNVSTEQRLKIWQNFINKCLDFLNNNINIPIIISLVRGFFENIQGTKYLPLKEGIAVQMMTIPIIIKSYNDEVLQKKNVNMLNNATFLCLRLHVIEELNLKNADFDIIVLANNIKLATESEEEYTLNVLESCKEKTLVLQLNKGSKESFQTKDKFKLQMANNPKFTDTLFELLSNSNVTLVDEVWEILTSLPLNKNLRTQIEKLSNIDGSEENWNKLLDYSCYRKFMYCLEILDDIVDADNNEEWSMKFIKKKGLLHLLKIYDQITFGDIQNSFNLKCFGLLAKILSTFLSKNNVNLPFDKVIPILISKALFLLFEAFNFIIKNPVVTTQIREEFYEKDTYMPKEFVNYNLNLIICCLSKNRTLITIIYNLHGLSSLLKNALLECNDANVRRIFQTGILALIEEQKKSLHELKEISPPHLFFLNRLLTDFKANADFLSYRSKCNNYFELLHTIFHKIPKEELKDVFTQLNLSDMQSFLVKEFLSLPTFEITPSDNDYYLQGLLQLFDCLIFVNPKTRVQLLEHSEFINYLFDACLFEKPTGLEPSETILPPKCKSFESRKAAFGLLNLLISEEIEHPKIFEIVEKMKKLLGNAYWRTNSSSDWNISSMYLEKSNTGYVGLKNLGCTCYMNSLLQQFFMIPEFRDAILAVPPKKNLNLDDSENLLYQFQLILAALKNSHKQYYDPRGFCYSNKDYEGKPVNVLEQMDVDEFFNNFLDKLEGEIKHSQNSEIIKKIFGGTLSNELICKGCPHYSEREEMFLALGLQVKNKKTLAESLDGFIQGEMLEGENAYFCDKCDKKIPTLKRTCIKKLPNMLIVVLKRFEFDYDKMIKIKVNDYCEFPRKLNMMAYTQNYLKKKETEKNTDDMENEENNNTATPLEDEFPPEYYDYNLKGVVIHIGTADSGHYYSLISEGKEKNPNSSEDDWLEFNDIHVRKFDINDLASEAFGGDEKNLTNSMTNTLTKSMKERSKNAYLLFYQRSKNFDENGQEISQLAVPEANESSANPKFYDEIKEDNVKYYINRNCFDPEFSNFIQKILVKMIENNRITDRLSMEFFKLGLLHFFAVIVRFREREKYIPSMAKILKKALGSNPELSNWFLMNASSEETIRETLIECPIRDIKYIFSGFYIEAIKKTLEEKKEAVFRMVDMCLHFLVECKERKQMDIFYRVLIPYSRYSRTLKKYFLDKRIIELIYFYICEQTFPNDFNFPKPQRVEPNEIGGLVNQKKTINIRSIEEIVEKKKEKSILESVSVNYSNLLIFFSNLICSIPFNEFSTNTKGKTTINPNLIEPLVEYKFNDEEKKVLIHQGFWKKMLAEGQSKISWKPISRFFCHLCTSNKPVTVDVIKVTLDELSVSDDNLKVYLKVLEALILLEDEFKPSRGKYIWDKLMTIFKEGIKFYKFSITLLDFFFKSSGRNALILKLFSDYLSENKTLYRNIEDWIKSLKDLSYHLNSGNFSIYKKKKAAFSTQIIQNNGSKLLKKLQEKLIKLNKIYKEDKEGLLPEYDSDEDYLDPPPKINDKIDILMDSGTVLSGVVADTFEDMFCVKNQNISRWITYDHEKAGPYGKLQEYYDDFIDFYK